jgi:cobalamin synthase
LFHSLIIQNESHSIALVATTSIRRRSSIITDTATGQTGRITVCKATRARLTAFAKTPHLLQILYIYLNKNAQHTTFMLTMLARQSTKRDEQYDTIKNSCSTAARAGCSCLGYTRAIELESTYFGSCRNLAWTTKLSIKIAEGEHNPKTQCCLGNPANLPDVSS